MATFILSIYLHTSYDIFTYYNTSLALTIQNPMKTIYLSNDVLRNAIAKVYLDLLLKATVQVFICP